MMLYEIINKKKTKVFNMANPNTAIWHGYDFKSSQNEPAGYHHTRVDDLQVGQGLEGVIQISDTKEGITFRYKSDAQRSILYLRVEFILNTEISQDFKFVGEFAVDFSYAYEDGRYHVGIPKTDLDTTKLPVSMSAGPKS